MSKNLFIFDKDGTLIDIHYYWGGMVKLRAEAIINRYISPKLQPKVKKELMSAMGIDIVSGKIKTNGPVGLKSREHVTLCAFNILNKYISADLYMVSDIFVEIDHYSKSILSELVKPLPGAKDLLRYLKGKNFKIALATTDLTKRAILAMEIIGLDSYFDYIVGADSVKNPKPSPDLVNLIADKCKCNRDEIVVIGDSIADLEMSKSSNVTFVGVMTGLYSEEFLDSSEIIVNTLNEIKELF